MTIEVAITILTCLVGAGVTIMLAGIPWAYGVHGRLTKIETSLSTHLEHMHRVSELDRRLSRLEMKYPDGTT